MEFAWQSQPNHAGAGLAPPARADRARAGDRPCRACAGNQQLQSRLLMRGIQPKLTVNQPGDRFEQEADRVAGEVMGMSGYQSAAQGAAAQSGLSRRQPACSGCKGELQRELQRESAGQGENTKTTIHARQMPGQTSEAGANLERQAGAVRGSGQPLPESVRSFFEPRFGHDFSPVRVHTDRQAAQAAQAVQARAYTLGKDIVFGAGQYAPATIEGKRLLAHELTHTVQQASEGATGIQRTIGDGHDLASPRFAGDPVLEAVFDDERLLAPRASGAAVRKVQQALVDAGFPLPGFGVDGIFGAETTTAVRDYQAAHGLAVDGIVGPITMGSLDAQFLPAAIPPAPPATPAAPAPPAPSPAPVAPAPLDVTGVTVVNQRSAIAFEEPGTGGPHFVTVAGSTGDAHVIVEATTNRPLNPGETVDWTFDPPGGGAVDAGNPARALVSRRRATRVQVTASSGATGRSLTVWAVFAQVRTVSGPTITFSPPAAPPPGSACGAPGSFCVAAPVNFDAEIFPHSLITSVNRPSFARAPVAPPGATNSCGGTLAGGVNGRFDMSRQISCAVVDPTGITGPVCVFTPRPFPTNNAEGNDDAGSTDEKNDPFAAGAIAMNGRAVAAGFIGSFDPPSLVIPHGLGAAGDTVEIQFNFREFARLDYHNTWFLISNRQPWFATFRAQKNAAGVWIDSGSTAG
jgi:peptidoglycan hydrolase-like protein with peptidoglycan-binding domain